MGHMMSPLTRLVGVRLAVPFLVRRQRTRRGRQAAPLQDRALHKDLLESPYSILEPAAHWFPADEALRESSMDKLMPPLVRTLLRAVFDFHTAQA
jgi:hypothetical protein